jgi:hypothetical protein
MYQVKNKTFKSYNAAVNHALRTGAAIIDERGSHILTMIVTDKVTYNGESLTVYQLKQNGVILADSSRRTVTVEGGQLADVRKPGEAKQPRRQPQKTQVQQFTINF